jgi:hypothetical protein
MYSDKTSSFRGQVKFFPEKVSKFLKLFRAARCFFQEEDEIEALMSCLEDSGRVFGIKSSAGREGMVEYLFLAGPV